ncbi:MAG: hypothetical protein H6873_12020 [Hyphomicrobiaceae bacterium]|nr:hypothetical protein [Hyphomicrobiaceae bacterium]
MKTYLTAFAVAALFAAPAQAATIGLSCPEGARVIVTEAGAEMTPIPAECEAGFVASHGYWSLAASADAVMSGASGGYSTQEGADAAAVAACVAKGAESCTVLAHGYDDGSGPMPDLIIPAAEPDAVVEEPAADLTAQEEAVLEDAVEEGAPVADEVVEVAEPSTPKVEVIAVVTILKVTTTE